jgi:hypothetical protein
MGDTSLFLHDQLGVACNSGAKLCGQGYRFIERVCVQGLGATEHRCHAFNCRPNDVVIRILLGQWPSWCLTMGPQKGAL